MHFNWSVATQVASGAKSRLLIFSHLKVEHTKPSRVCQKFAALAFQILLELE